MASPTNLLNCGPDRAEACREGLITLARWVFLLIGTVGILVGSWQLFNVNSGNEDGRKIAMASLVALLTGIILTIDVLRTGAVKRRD